MSASTASLFISAALLFVFGLLIISTLYAFRLGFTRMDEIVTGVVNGVRVSMKHRWYILIFGFTAFANAAAILHAVFAIGYFQVAKAHAGSEAVENVAIVCGAASAWGFVAIVLPSIALTVYMMRVLRQADEDSP